MARGIDRSVRGAVGLDTVNGASHSTRGAAIRITVIRNATALQGHLTQTGGTQSFPVSIGSVEIISTISGAFTGFYVFAKPLQGHIVFNGKEPFPVSISGIGVVGEISGNFVSTYIYATALQGHFTQTGGDQLFSVSVGGVEMEARIEGSYGTGTDLIYKLKILRFGTQNMTKFGVETSKK